MHAQEHGAFCAQHLVVVATLFWVRQRLVSAADLHEDAVRALALAAVLALFALRALVGVVLERKLVVRLLDLPVLCVLLDAQNLQCTVRARCASRVTCQTRGARKNSRTHARTHARTNAQSATQYTQSRDLVVVLLLLCIRHLEHKHRQQHRCRGLPPASPFPPHGRGPRHRGVTTL